MCKPTWILGVYTTYMCLAVNKCPHHHCIECRVKLLAIICEVQWDGLRTFWFLQWILIHVLTTKLFMKIPHIFSTALWIMTASPFICKLPFKNWDVQHASLKPRTKEQIDQQRECRNVHQPSKNSLIMLFCCKRVMYVHSFINIFAPTLDLLFWKKTC